MGSTSITSNSLTQTLGSTHQTPLVGGVPFGTGYHSDTSPCNRRITAAELSLYDADPTKIVGKTFLPLNSETTWEVFEVAFSTKGWSSVTVQFEGAEKHHKMEFIDFVTMLKSGSLLVVELD